MANIMQADERLLKRTVLPGTLYDVERIQREYLLTAWKKFFADRFTRFQDEHVPSTLDPAMVQHLSTTHFGLHLFKLAPANETKPKIRNFIKFLASEKSDYISTINIFNALCEKLANYECGELPLEDEIIEHRNKQFGIQREMSEDEAKLYSMWEDLTPRELEGILARYGKNGYED